MMKYLIIILLALGLLGCAVQSPFTSKDKSLQVSGATAANDPERILGASYITIKALRAGSKIDYILGLAKILKAASTGNVTRGALSNLLENYIASKAKHPEDKMLVTYFMAKLQLKTGDITLPFSPEQKRVLVVYADALKDAVKDFEK